MNQNSQTSLDHNQCCGCCQAARSASGQVAPTVELSVVIPIYNEEENVYTLLERLSGVLKSLACSYEIIFVDDGSNATTKAALEKALTGCPQAKVVELSRNFGHQIALSAGLDQACGAAVIVMDGDLQDPPEAIVEFLAQWHQGYEVVYAIRESRPESLLKRFCYAAFYRILRFFSHIRIPLDAGDFCLMDRAVVVALRELREHNRFLRGMRSWLGFRQVGVPIARQARHSGQPKYSLRRLARLAFDGLFSFSYLPLRLISITGAVVAIFSIGLTLFYLIKRTTVGLSPPGFATIVILVSFFSGVQLLTLGLIGEYVGRIFEEARQRPLYVVRRINKGPRP